MIGTPIYNYKVLKVFNNNVLLVEHNSKEKILYSKGIGFGKKTGDIVPIGSSIDKIYSIEDKSNSNKFNQLLTYVDSGLVGLCEEIIYMMGMELNEELDEKIHISLTDHIAFALKRLRENDEIANPFLVETEILYRREFEIAKKAISILQKRIGISIPDGEIGFITLHIHSARQHGKLSNTLKYAFLTNSIAERIEQYYNVVVDRQSISYARFVTHLRFAIERIINKNPIKNALLGTIRREYPESYKLAEEICTLIERQLQIEVVEDEVGYIALHIEKLKSD